MRRSIKTQLLCQLTTYVTKINIPPEQMKALDEIFKHMENEPFPKNREQFEKQKEIYWN